MFETKNLSQNLTIFFIFYIPHVLACKFDEAPPLHKQFFFSEYF